MKTILSILSFLFLSLIFLFILQGCENDEIPIDNSQIEVSVVPINPEYGESTFLSWEFSVKYIKVNVSIGDSVISTEKKMQNFELKNLREKTIISFSGFIDGVIDPEVKSVEVIPLPLVLPSISITSDEDTVLRGDATILRWKIIGDFDSFESNIPMFNGFPEGSVLVRPAESEIYTIKLTKQGELISKSISVAVRDSTMVDIICQSAYEYSLWEGIFCQDCSWEPMGLGEYEYWKVKFYPYPNSQLGHYPYSWEQVDERTNEIIGQGPWSLSNDTLNWFTDFGWKIKTANKNTLILEGQVHCYGDGCYQPIVPRRITLSR